MQTADRVRLANPACDLEEIEAVAAVLRSGNLVQGAQVEAFELGVARYLGVKHAVANSSGTAALHLALLALGVGPGDEVILPDLTFPATANMVEALGATSVIVDIDPATFNLDVSSVADRITERTRAIMPVHLFGLVADLRPLIAMSEARGIPLIEDAACALGATYPGPDGGSGQHVGTETALTCLSFHPRKVITTGEGGMVVTDDDQLAARLRMFRNHGTTSSGGRMVFHEAGFNYRLTEMQGAMGGVQLGRLEAYIARRQAIAALYDELLEPLPVTVPGIPAGFTSVYQAYVVMLPASVDRDAVIVALRTQGVESNIGTYALHPQPYYLAKYGDLSAQLPHSAAAFRHSLALPIHHRMTDAEAHRVVTTLTGVLGA